MVDFGAKAAIRQSHTAKNKQGAIALPVTVAAFCAVSICTSAPSFADDDSADFFKFKNSDFFEVYVKRKDDKKKEKEEEREDEKQRKMDDKWTNRPTNPKMIWQDTFVDTDFSKHTFQDLRNNNDLSSVAVSAVRKDSDSHLDADARRPDEDLDVDKSDRDDYRKRMKADDFKTFNDLTAPVPGMLHDWVPSPMDREQNGGFTQAPDNGFVVPYTLNGWIEIQRKLPWEAEP